MRPSFALSLSCSGLDSSCSNMPCCACKAWAVHSKADVKRVAKTVKRKAHAKEHCSELEPLSCVMLACSRPHQAQPASHRNSRKQKGA